MLSYKVFFKKPSAAPIICQTGLCISFPLFRLTRSIDLQQQRKQNMLHDYEFLTFLNCCHFQTEKLSSRRGKSHDPCTPCPTSKFEIFLKFHFVLNHLTVLMEWLSLNGYTTGFTCIQALKIEMHSMSL